MMKRKKVIAKVLVLIIAFTACFSEIRISDAGTNKEDSKKWAAAYLEIVKKLNKQDSNSKASVSSDFWNQPYTYDLIYFNNDNVPELVAGLDGYWVSMYTYDKKQDKVYQVMDEWGYGAMGNAGYEYLPKKNFLRNYNSDYAGAIRCVYCGKMKNHKMESRYPKELKEMYFKDKNKNGIPDEGEYTEQASYYYGSKKISKKKFNSYIKQSGKFKAITGTMVFKEIRKKLRDLM